MPHSSTTVLDSRADRGRGSSRSCSSRVRAAPAATPSEWSPAQSGPRSAQCSPCPAPVVLHSTSRCARSAGTVAAPTVRNGRRVTALALLPQLCFVLPLLPQWEAVHQRPAATSKLVRPQWHSRSTAPHSGTCVSVRRQRTLSTEQLWQRGEEHGVTIEEGQLGLPDIAMVTLCCAISSSPARQALLLCSARRIGRCIR